MPRSRPLPLVRAALPAAALLAAVLLPVPARALPPQGGYVALGDSFAAAPLVPLMTSLQCHRSSADYPARLARRLGATDFTDVSCDSAHADDLTAPQDTELLGVATGSVPPQLDALKDTTALVTLTIGGGDTGLVGVAQKCVNLLPEPWGKPCVDTYVQGGTDQVAARIDAFGPELGAALDTIHARAPQARVVVTGYGRYIRPGGCWPVQPFLARDATFLQGSVDRLNQVIAAQAAAHDALYVDLAGPGAGHDSCALPAARWLEGLLPTSIAAPLHPNAAGSAAFANLIAAALDQAS